MAGGYGTISDVRVSARLQKLFLTNAYFYLHLLCLPTLSNTNSPAF